MAIEKYTFVKSEAYWETVFDSITTNGIFDGYFDKIEYYDEANSTNKRGLAFYIGEKIALEIYTDDVLITAGHSCNINFYLANGQSWNFNYGAGGSHYIYAFTKTASGVIINIATDTKQNEAIFISKTDKGNVGFAFTTFPDDVDATNAKLFCVSFDNSEGFKESSYSLPDLVEEDNTTVLCALVCRNCVNSEYLTGCRLMKYTEYKGVNGTFEMNDKQYITNGYLVLEV